MKPLPIVLLSALAAFAATGARADHSRVNIDVGISIGSARPVYVEPAPVVVVPAGHRHIAPARGYWDVVTVKTWMPGRWVHSYDRRGRPHRFFEKGHYVYRTERVWVETGRGRGGEYRHAYNGGHRRWDR